MGRSHVTFSGSMGNAEGFGYYKGDIGFFGGSFEGFINVQTSDLSKRKSLGVEARITAYGAIGTDGFGKIFEKTYPKHENDSNYVSLNFADSFSGVGVSVISYTYIGYVDGNSFNLYEN
ncbi:hypothetical protein, partial [Paenibacillus sp. 7541]